jgi:hypothetical protein
MGEEVTPLVECHSGYTYAEKPIALHWEGERQEIAEIEAEWRRPEGKGFRVRTVRGDRYELFYNEKDSDWRITPV